MSVAARTTSAPDRADMVQLAGGAFRMGSDEHYPEEAPVRTVEVGAFRIDRTPVTNARFRAFVQDTGYLTLAERPPDPADYPDLDIAAAEPGSLVFVRPRKGDGPAGPETWWKFVIGASWHQPLGPGHPAKAFDAHPVVHIAWEDACAFADWAGKALPNEAEWEFAARGGHDGCAFAWGSVLAPAGRRMANYWAKGFPYANPAARTALLTTPVGRFPANDFGLSDMIGNVWEWTVDDFDGPAPETPCCNSPEAGSSSLFRRKVLKGGSHLCAPEYCRRYRPAARYPQMSDSATSHIGFRCIVRDG